MVFIDNIRSAQDAVLLSKKINRLIREAFPDEEFGKDVSVSIGIVVCPVYGTCYEELYSKADKALYYMKRHGKSGCMLYDASLEES